MRVLIAMYDPASATPQGDYWVWRHPEIPAALAESLFNNLAASREPTTPPVPKTAEIGFASLDANWGAWYRFFFGGEIRRKRYVLACAFIRRAELQPAASLGPWEASPLAGLAERAPHQRPLPPPSTLAIEWSPPLASPNATLLSEWKRGGEWVYEGHDYAQQTLAACALLPLSQTFHCRISQRANIVRVALTVRTETVKAPVPAVPAPSPQRPSPPSTPQPRPQSPPRGVTRTAAPPAAAPVHPSILVAILRNKIAWVFVGFLLGASAVYLSGKCASFHSSDAVPPTFSASLPDMKFLQRLLDAADKLAAIPGVQSPQKLKQRIAIIRSDLNNRDITPNQVTEYCDDILELLDELTDNAAAQAAPLPQANP